MEEVLRRRRLLEVVAPSALRSRRYRRVLLKCDDVFQGRDQRQLDVDMAGQ